MDLALVDDPNGEGPTMYTRTFCWKISPTRSFLYLPSIQCDTYTTCLVILQPLNASSFQVRNRFFGCSNPIPDVDCAEQHKFGMMIILMLMMCLLFAAALFATKKDRLWCLSKNNRQASCVVSIWESLLLCRHSWIVVHVFEADIIGVSVVGMPSFAQEVWGCVFDSRSVVCVFHHAVSGEGERTATTRTG